MKMKIYLESWKLLNLAVENYINLKSWNFAYITFGVKIQIQFLSTNEKKLSPTQLSQS